MKCSKPSDGSSRGETGDSSPALPTAAEMAALRAWTEGIPTHEAVDRYLSGQTPQGKTSRWVIGNIRRKLAAAARLQRRQDLAQKIESTKDRSSKILDLAKEAFETVRQARVPEVGDGIHEWFDDRTGSLLANASILTLADLAIRRARRKLWHKDVPGLGPVRARQVEAFLDQYPQIGELARKTVLAPAAMDIRPWESIIVPEHVDGTAGRFRAPSHACSLRATNDYEAVQAWLSLHESSATQRAYRKEAERLILWAILERGQALSSLTMEDAAAYRGFLRNPAPVSRWVGPAIARSSGQWRPFTGPLGARSVGFSLTVLNALFRFLKAKNYVLANPFDGMKALGDQGAVIQVERAFTQTEWQIVRTVADGLEYSYGWHPDSANRLRMVLDFAYATGLRAHELLCATLGNIEVDATGNSWIRVKGKGGKLAKVALPMMARSALERYLVQRGLEVAPSKWSAATPLIATVNFSRSKVGTRSMGITTRRLNAIVRDFFEAVAVVVEGENPQLATKLRRATPHWMRHTHATHALSRGVGLTTVRDNLRHASIKTTSLYLHAQDDQRAAELGHAFNT